jgi:hypothetical protein
VAARVRAEVDQRRERRELVGAEGLRVDAGRLLLRRDGREALLVGQALEPLALGTVERLEPERLVRADDAGRQIDRRPHAVAPEHLDQAHVAAVAVVDRDDQRGAPERRDVAPLQRVDERVERDQAVARGEVGQVRVELLGAGLVVHQHACAPPGDRLADQPREPGPANPGVQRVPARPAA